MKINQYILLLNNIFEKKISLKDNLEKIGFDSLKTLEIMALNDKHFKNIKISPDKLSKCKTVNDLVKLYGKKLSK